MKLKTAGGKRLLGMALAVAVLAVGLGLWTSGTSRPDIIYLSDAARRSVVRHVVNATGEVKAAQLVTVGAQVSGQIVKIHVQVGQMVNKGELIAEINATTQQNQLETDKALLQSYQERLESKKISRRIAERQYRREKALRAREAASQEDLESAETAWAFARAEVAELEALVRQTELAVNTDMENLGYTRITAPLAGTVVSVPVEEGQTVNAAQSTPTIAQIADLGRMEICLEISEGDIPAVRPGMAVSYTILGEPDVSAHAVLTSIDPGLTTLSDGTYESSSSSSTGSASSSSSSSGTAVYYYGKALVDNGDARLRIGMTVQAVIVTAEKADALTVPLLAVEDGPEGKRVQVLADNGGTEARRVVTGLSDGVRMEIVDGLREGEKVVAGRVTREEMDARTELKGPGPGGPH